MITESLDVLLMLIQLLLLHGHLVNQTEQNATNPDKEKGKPN